MDREGNLKRTVDEKEQELDKLILLTISFLVLFLIKFTSNLGCWAVFIFLVLVAIPISYSLYIIAVQRRYVFIDMVLRPDSKFRRYLQGGKFIFLFAFFMSLLFGFSLLVYLYQPMDIEALPFLLSPILFFFLYRRWKLSYLQKELKDNTFLFFKEWSFVVVFSIILLFISIPLSILDLYLYKSNFLPFVSEEIYDKAIQNIKHSCKIFKFVVRLSYSFGESINSLKNLPALSLGWIIIVKISMLSMTVYSAIALYLLGVFKFLEKKEASS